MIGMQTLFLIAGLAYVAHLAWHRWLPGRTRLDWAIAALIGAYLIAISFSIYPRFSLEAAFLTATVILTFYVFSDIDELTPALIVRGLAAVGLVGAIYALYRVSDDYWSWLSLVEVVKGDLSFADLIPPSVPRVHDVGDHVNMIALAFNLTLPFSLVLALAGRSRTERLLAILASIFILVALFFTVSRAAWAGTAVAMPLFALAYAAREKALPALRLPRLSRPALFGALALAACMLAVVLFLAVALWDSRPEWLFRSSLSPRYDAFDVAAQIIREKPWTGSGPNTFSLLYNAYSGDYPIENFHPHNGYLAVLVDTGIPGALAVAAIGGALAYSLISTYRNGPLEHRAWAAACMAAFVALAVHSLADMPNQSKTALLLAAAIAALSLKLAPRPVAPTRFFSPGNLPRVAILAFVPLFLAVWLWTDLGHISYDDSVELMAKGQMDSAMEKALDAADRDPNMAVYHLQAGVTQAIAYLMRQERGETRHDLAAGAVASLKQAVEFDPRSAVGHANLALALRLVDDRQAATEQALLAMESSPSDGTIAAVAATVLEWAGRREGAISGYARAISHEPGLLQSPFWTTTPFRSEVRGTAIERSDLTDCLKARVTALYSGFPDDLQKLADGCRELVEASGDARDRSDLAIALHSLGREEEALTEARLAVAQAPDNAYARTALGVALGPFATEEAIRNEFARAAFLNDPDGALLLAWSYDRFSVPTLNQNLDYAPDRFARFPLLETDTGPPDEVLDILEDALPAAAPFFYDRGVQRYLLGILHYRPRYFRESPISILIPGDWMTLTAPRTLFIQETLRKAGR
jgi:tetratricopeptide (TPR) repeat protein